MSERALDIISQMDELTGKVKAANDARATFIEERTRMVSDIIAKIGRLKLKNVTNGTEIQALQEQLKEKQEKLESIQKEVAEHTAGGETLRKQISNLEEENKAKKDELTDVKTKLAESEHV